MGKYRIWAKKNTWAYKDIDVDSKEQADTIADEMQTLEGFKDVEDFNLSHTNHWTIDVDDIERLPDKWTEIRCDYFDDVDGNWLVDAWKTPEDDNGGVVIAKISEDGQVVYLDEDAKTDDYAQEVINEKLKELEQEVER